MRGLIAVLQVKNGLADECPSIGKTLGRSACNRAAVKVCRSRLGKEASRQPNNSLPDKERKKFEP